MPVLLDTAERMARYESNELRDAGARWLEKGKEDKFQAWEEEFYSHELPTFIRKSFRPYVEAGMIDPDLLKDTAAQASAKRQEAVTALKTGEALSGIEGIDPDVFICDLLGTSIVPTRE
jgi:hypothetical protein